MMEADAPRCDRCRSIRCACKELDALRLRELYSLRMRWVRSPGLILWELYALRLREQAHFVLQQEATSAQAKSAQQWVRWSRLTHLCLQREAATSWWPSRRPSR